MVRSLYKDFLNFNHVVKCFLLVLICTDFAFLILHVVAAFYMRSSTDFDFYLITRDRSYAEIFQYMKEFWIAIFIVLLAVYNKNTFYYLLALLFVYLFADDMLGIHEGVSIYMKETFLSIDAGKMASAIMQVIFSFLVFIIFAILIWSSFKGGDHLEYEQFAKKLIILIVLLAIFGVGIDFLHSLYNLIDKESEYVNQILGLIEDWGEMIVMTGIVAFVYSELVSVRNTLQTRRKCQET